MRVRSYALVLIYVHDFKFRNPELPLYPIIGQTRDACLLQSVGQKEFKSEAILPSAVVVEATAEYLFKLVRHWEVTG